MKKLSNFAATVSFIFFVTSTVFSQHYTAEKLQKYLEDMGNTNEVNVVIPMIKMELTDYYPAEITAAIKQSYPELPTDRTIRVPSYVRENMITKGGNYNRVKDIADKLLKYMSLQERIRFIYFHSDVPVTAFSYPFALIISNSAADILTDDELEAVMAHEICHLIVYQNFKSAVDSNNLKQMRAIELFCDGGAIAIIETMGKDPKNLISGLEKMQELLKRVNNDIDGGTKHPTLKQRRQFFKELTQKFSLATNRAIK